MKDKLAENNVCACRNVSTLDDDIFTELTSNNGDTLVQPSHTKIQIFTKITTGISSPKRLFQTEVKVLHVVDVAGGGLPLQVLPKDVV